MSLATCSRMTSDRFFAIRAWVRICFFVIGFLAANPSAFSGEGYPSRPIRLVVPTGAGGITDILARLVGQRLGEKLGARVLIENRDGANGVVGSQVVANAAPDGYTLVFVYPAHPVNASLIPNLPYDTVKSFSPITMVSSVGLLLVTNPSLPVKTVSELIAFAKSRPGQLNYGAVGVGSLGQLGAELFRFQTGADMTHVAYKSSPQIMTALLGGDISVYFVTTLSSAVPLVKSGKLRALGVSTNDRLRQLPDVPPISDTVPGFDVRGWNGVLGPAGMPRPLISLLNQEIVRIVRLPDFVERLAEDGAVPVGNTPEQFEAVIRSDIAKWAKVIKDAGIKAN
jgi:tripartite-type tricarboxylate transporter receptor subunit TctC